MKWGIVVLLIFGVIAAACAAILVTTMGANSSAAAKNTQSFEVVVAKKSLPAMSVVTVDDFVKQKIARNELPQQGQISNPTRVIGRVLAMPVVEGQVLTESCFIADGTGAQLAAAIPEGMRMFTVNLNSKAIPDRLLIYPGCVVDVLVSFKLSSQDRAGQALSTNVLQNIQVLAVQGESVVSKSAADDGKESKPRPQSGGLQVTLLVNEQQAKALQLAVDNGNISLAFRNPLDKNLGGTEAMILNQGRLATSGSALDTEALAGPQKNNQREQEKGSMESQIVPGGDPNKPAAEPSDVFQPLPDQKSQTPRSSNHTITVIRGSEKKTEEIPAGSKDTAEK